MSVTGMVTSRPTKHRIAPRTLSPKQASANRSSDPMFFDVSSKLDLIAVKAS